MYKIPQDQGVKECDTSNLQLVRYSSCNLKISMLRLYAPEATVMGWLLQWKESPFYVLLCYHIQKDAVTHKEIPGNYWINVTNPKLKYMPPCHTERGKK